MKIINGYAGGHRHLITVGRILAALLCTHIAAFRVQANMRSTLMRRILTLPLIFGRVFVVKINDFPI